MKNEHYNYDQNFEKFQFYLNMEELIVKQLSRTIQDDHINNQETRRNSVKNEHYNYDQNFDNNQETRKIP